VPRNRYTRFVRVRERAQLAHQEKQLVQLIRQLRRGTTESPVVIPLTGAKERRSTRLAQNRLHKLSRSNPSVETKTA
jgi:hypothetical protein